MTLFMVIEKHIWRKGLLVVLLLCVALAVYLIWPTEDDGTRSNFGEGTFESPAISTIAGDLPSINDCGSVATVSVEPIYGGFFDDYRLNREKTRSAQTEYLKEMLAQEPNLADSPAQQELIRVLQWMEKETQAEGLLKTIGYEQAIVVLSDSGANIVVSEIINQSEAEKLGDIVSQVTGLPLAKITISDGVSFQ